jgi:hypothetical protein
VRTSTRLDLVNTTRSRALAVLHNVMDCVLHIRYGKAEPPWESAFSAVQRWVRGRESDLSSADVKLSVPARCSVRCGMLVASQ